MKRAIGDDLERALDLYLSQQEFQPTLTAVVQAALAEFLARRGSTPPADRLRITPARKGGGKSDVSRLHDQR